MAKKNKIKKTVVYETTVTQKEDAKESKFKALLLGMRMRRFDDVTTFSITDKKTNKDIIEKVVVKTDNRKRLKYLISFCLANGYNADTKILETITEKEEPKKK